MQPLIAKISTVEARIGQVEAAFTDRMKEQITLLTAITATQSQHSADLANFQSKDKANQDTFQDIQQRLAKLEAQPLLSRATSTTTAQDRQPALIMGGWADDQEAATTLHLAKEACNNLKLDIDMQDAFVPGIRRGYLVSPHKLKENENEQAMFSRFTQAIHLVRQANQPRHFWLSFSQTPERRRLLEQGASKGHLQVEYATGTAWY